MHHSMSLLAAERSQKRQQVKPASVIEAVTASAQAHNTIGRVTSSEAARDDVSGVTATVVQTDDATLIGDLPALCWAS